MFIGVDKNRENMIYSCDGFTLDADSDGIFDATEPCLDTCNFSSLLMKWN